MKMIDLHPPMHFKFSVEMSNPKLIKEGMALRAQYVEARNQIAELRKRIDKKQVKIDTKDKRIANLNTTIYHHKVDERRDTLKIASKAFMAAISLGEMSYLMVKYAIYLKFTAFKKDTINNKMMLDGTIMSDAHKKQFRNAVSKMAAEELMSVSHKTNGIRANYYLTHKGKEECALFIKKLQQTKLI